MCVVVGGAGGIGGRPFFLLGERLSVRSVPVAIFILLCSAPDDDGSGGGGRGHCCARRNVWHLQRERRLHLIVELGAA